MTYMIVSKLIIQTLYTALFQFKCCDSSIDLDEISLPSSTVIEGLLQEHPSLLSLSDVQEAVSVSKSTQECLKPEPEPVFQVTEKVVKTGPRKGNTEQKVTLGKWYNSLHLQWLPECWRPSRSLRSIYEEIRSRFTANLQPAHPSASLRPCRSTW